jgi:hypothetical protein
MHFFYYVIVIKAYKFTCITGEIFKIGVRKDMVAWRWRNVQRSM